MFRRNTREAGSFTLRMSCRPWHPSHPGTPEASFVRSFFPWALPAYDFSASPWHLLQLTFPSLSCGAFASAWQVTQEVPPCTDCRYSWRST